MNQAIARDSKKQQKTSIRPRSQIDVLSPDLFGPSTTQSANSRLCPLTWLIPEAQSGERMGRKPRGRKKKKTSTKVHVTTGRRIRRPFNEADREVTAQTRRDHACMRCRFQKATCRPDPDNPTGECMTCRDIRRPTLTRLACVRWIITDASLYREQKAPFHLFSKRWSSMDMTDITHWASTQDKTFILTQRFLRAPYEVRVRRFYPMKGDLLEEIWHEGSRQHTYKLPPYAVVNMQETAEMFRDFIDTHIGTYIYGAVPEDRDLLLRLTYIRAFKHSIEAKTSIERNLLLNALRLWVACRKTSNPEGIINSDVLDESNMQPRPRDWNNLVPIPPIMIAQFECIMYTTFLRPLSRQVLHALQELVYANKRQYWFTIYLTMFVLLHSCSMTTFRDQEYAQQLGLDEQYCNPEAIEGHHSGAKVVIAHFRLINKGELPFNLSMNPNRFAAFIRDADLSEEQANFVRDTASMVETRESLFAYLREEGLTGHDLYWVGQLYDPTWQPH